MMKVQELMKKGFFFILILNEKKRFVLAKKHYLDVKSKNFPSVEDITVQELSRLNPDDYILIDCRSEKERNVFFFF